MGAAIECFDAAGAIVVPRSRFAPVKTTSDLFALRSDAYVVAEDSSVVLAKLDGAVKQRLLDRVQHVADGAVQAIL